MAKIKSYEQLRTHEVAVMVEKVFSVIQSSGEMINGDQNNSNGPAPMGIRSIALGQVRNVLFSLCIGERFDSLPPTGYLSEFPEIFEQFLDVFMSVNLVWKNFHTFFSHTWQTQIIPCTFLILPHSPCQLSSFDCTD